MSSPFLSDGTRLCETIETVCNGDTITITVTLTRGGDRWTSCVCCPNTGGAFEFAEMLALEWAEHLRKKVRA